MSTHIDMPHLPPSPPHFHFSRLLAFYVERRRGNLNLTAEAAARLAGMELSQWDALESGWVPEDPAQLRAIAAVLENSEEDIVSIAVTTRHYQGPPA